MAKRTTPLKILIAKPGLDGHDVGAKVVARAMRDAGFEVIYSGLHQSPKSIAHTALQEDVNVIGLSILSGAHLPLCEKLMAELRNLRIQDIPVIVGGVIPERDKTDMYRMGVKEIFPSETKFDDIIAFLQEHIQ